MTIFERFFIKQSRAVIFTTALLLMICSGIGEKHAFSKTGDNTTQITVGNPVSTFLLLYGLIWLWVLARYFNDKLPQNAHHNIQPLKYALIFAFIGYCPFLIFAWYNVELIINSTFWTALSLMFIIFEGILISFCVWQTSKIVKRYFNITFSNNFIAAVLQLWLFPLTIWKLQPRIQDEDRPTLTTS